jgi:transcriptional regulator with XRE-family HTH domain
VDYEKAKADGLRASQAWREGIGAAVKAARTKRGWTQKALADLAGVDISTVGTIERGVVPPSLATIWTFADLLAVSLDTIVGRTWAGSTLPAADESPGQRPLQVDEARVAALERRLAAALGTVETLVEEVKKAQTQPAPKTKRRVRNG